MIFTPVGTRTDGTFAIAAEPGNTTLKIMADGFETVEESVAIESARPLNGLYFKFRHAARDPEVEADFESVLRGLVRKGVENWGPHSPNIAGLLHQGAINRWPTLVHQPIVIAATQAIDIYIASPYLMYETAVAEAARKMEQPTEIPYPHSVGVFITPKEIGAPDIEKLVVQRDGKIIEPTDGTLATRVFRSRMGSEELIHAGLLTYAPAAFAPGAAVAVTAIPRTGRNIVVKLDAATLEGMK